MSDNQTPGPFYKSKKLWKSIKATFGEPPYTDYRPSYLEDLEDNDTVANITQAYANNAERVYTLSP